MLRKFNAAKDLDYKEQMVSDKLKPKFDHMSLKSHNYYYYYHPCYLRLLSLKCSNIIFTSRTIIMVIIIII